jgi:tight adherence protein B
LGELLGLDAPPTAILSLAAIGVLLGLLAGELLDLGVAARLTTCLMAMAAVFGGRSAMLSARSRNLGPLVHSFIQEVHLSAMAGETAGRAILEASAHTTEPLKRHLHQAKLAVQSGEGAFAAYGGIAVLTNLAEYQGFIYSLWLHEQTGSSFGQLLGHVVAQSDEATLAKRELAAKLGEARWTARVLAGVPLALLAFLHFAQPDFVAPLVGEPIGRQALMLGGLLWIAGLVASSWLQRPPRELSREG